MKPSAADFDAVRDLLGRQPSGEFEVVVRHVDGGPLVIRNAPLLSDGTPMPTLYWLVGEPERRWVGTIESEGGVDRAEAEVDPRELAEAHDRYAALRDAALPVGHDGLRSSGGVGGTRVGVKCLHAHYAWYLAGGDDPVGRWVADQITAHGWAPEIAPRVVGAIDCGTNSTRLLVARLGADGTIETLDRLMTITRLGQDVDRTGRLAPEAIGRTVEAIATYRSVLDDHGAVAVRSTATSAARDADNRDEFFEAAEAALGAPLELLAGEAEGMLSFQGAMADMPPAPGSVLVFDLGGGSTELIWGSLHAAADPVLHAVRSLDAGCVRATERWLHSDPPTESEVAAAATELREMVEAALAEMGVVGVDRFVGLAGTVSALAAIDQGLIAYDHDLIHHHVLSAEAIDRITRQLTAMTVAERLEVVGLEAARAPVIVGGCLVLQAVMAATGATEVVHSEADILDGLAASLVAAGP